MALDKVLKVYDDNGNEIDYDILAKDVKFLPDGKDLPTKLAELEDEIGQGGYAPPAGGIPKSDLAQSVQDSLDKADSALQEEDVAEVAKTGDYDDLQNKPTIPDTSNLATKTELATKQDTLVAGNGITIAQDGKTVSVDAEVVQPVTADGTFAIRIGSNTYTINLNHEHQGMAKLAKFVASNPPASIANDTIYAQVNNLTTPTEIESIWLFGCEFKGGGEPDTGEPVVKSPSNGSTINLGDNDGSGVSKTITVRGANLLGDLTVSVSTGLTLSYGQSSGQSSVTIPMAQALLGAVVTVAYGGTGGFDGTLTVTHDNNILSTVAVKAAWGYNTNGLVFHLDGADATTSRWVDRKGGIAFAMNNVTLDGNGGVVFNGTNAYGRYAAADSLGFSATTHTIEVVANIGGTAAGCIFMQNAANSLAFGLTSSGNLIYAAGMSTEQEPVQRKVIGFGRGLHTASFANTVGYKDKASLTIDNLGLFISAGNNLGVFIGSRDSENVFFTGTIYQIRIYNRLLSQQEILANQQLDIDRYNIS